MHKQVIDILQGVDGIATVGGNGTMQMAMNNGLGLHELPAVFVIPSEIVSERVNNRPNDYEQWVNKTTLVLCAVPSIDDTTGAYGLDGYDGVFDILKTALLGKTVTGALTPTEFVKMEYIDTTDGVAWYGTFWQAKFRL